MIDEQTNRQRSNNDSRGQSICPRSTPFDYVTRIIFVRASLLSFEQSNFRRKVIYNERASYIARIEYAVHHAHAQTAALQRCAFFDNVIGKADRILRGD